MKPGKINVDAKLQQTSKKGVMREEEKTCLMTGQLIMIHGVR